MDSVKNLRKSHAEWIRAALGGAERGRDEIWTKSVTVVRPRKPHAHALGLTSIGNVTMKMGIDILTFGLLNEIN
jgi:hypothetical protein